MQIATGKIWMSSSNMDDDNFKNAVIFITEHNENGTMAFIINKTFDRRLNELIEFNSSPDFPLYRGGPVDTEHIFFIHCRADLITGGTKIMGDIHLGGDFKKAIEQINNKVLTEKDIKIFVGYCGWDKGELEAEIADGYWLYNNSNHKTAFDK